MKTSLETLHEISISYKPHTAIYLEKSISQSSMAHCYLREFYNPDTIGCQEQFVVLYLNRANKPIGAIPLFVGGCTSTVVDIKLILSIALKSLASGIIISHNHPSGSLEPSREDKNITQKLKDACSMVDVLLIDHLILSLDNNYVSFADMGWMLDN
jgi:DNA repair protein RadC